MQAEKLLDKIEICRTSEETIGRFETNNDFSQNEHINNKISYADCWSPSERKAKATLESIKGFIFNPIVNILIKLGITPNTISYISAIVGLTSAVFMWFDLKIAAILLIVSLLIDGTDGSLARATNKCSFKGSITDSFTDQIVISASTIGLIAINLLNPIIGGLYLVLYPIVIIFTILRNILNIPRKYVFRPRIIVYCVFGLYVLSSINILNYVVLPFSLILLLQVVVDFYCLRSVVND